ncbi:DNA helicase/exodeoxyribonuclease V, subunit B [Thermanaeromonas toyohensis ToBE]|uniref:ATP-dependent helicase/deoxyribonuclease subunit B n=1 Tax=Thermanaeromonas toyohensis ToBE TaxID=698762 RepID=A0A1W1VWY6_9FIRM|nr:helicase-exonuclease AddAB subunit AddB [Thermanaeromonas toyohensis]SMB97882.1 DNA helicase/exodeoxyribonuclease V, subunit B [Thermanaeromonas toyohensis ToBE]
MSLHFILGRAGSGKTRYCLQEIRKELLAAPQGPAIILLVPEQATFQMEKALVNLPGLQGSIRCQVLSFQRLAWRVSQEVGGAARPSLSDLAKHMLLRRLLKRRAKHLKILHLGAWHQPGFIHELASTLKEFKYYCLSPSKLREAAASLDLKGTHELLAVKLHDLALIWEDMEKTLEGNTHFAEDYLEILASNLLKAPSLKEAEIWLDGFSSFTPQEYKVLEGLLKAARRVHITLCMNAQDLEASLSEGDPFYPPKETFKKLQNLAVRLNVPVEPMTVLDQGIPPRFAEVPILAWVEKNFFTPFASPWPQEVVNLKIFSSSNRRAEVETVAREILYLSRTKGYRWRDIAIMVRNLELYQSLLVNVLRDYEIPFFLDVKRPITHHPLVKLICTALETVSQNWAYEPLFRLLKTDLLPLSREEVDVLENYVLACGIQGSRWLDSQPWTYQPRWALENEKETLEINLLKNKVVALLGDFHRALRQAQSVQEITLALYELLLKLKVPEKLEEWRLKAMENGQWEEAQEHAQIWETIIEILEQLVDILGEERIDLQEYQQIIMAALEGELLGLIPQGLDQVLVISLDRSRLPEVRAAFLLGVNEGIFPARPLALGFLKDEEREYLLEKGWEVGPSSRRRLLEEQHLVYLALTRSREFLGISYALADEEGNALRPSPIIARLKALLPQLKEIPSIPEPITHPRPLLSQLAINLSKLKSGADLEPVWLEVYNWARSHPLYKEILAKIIRGLFYSNQEPPLPKDIAYALYGDPLKTTVSRLEEFKKCPFSHFLKYGLKLKERQRYQLLPPDLGEFFHTALKELAVALRKQHKDWKDLELASCQKLCQDVVEKLLPKFQNEIFFSTARYRYLTHKLIGIIQRTAAVLVEQAKWTSFRTVGSEVTFGSGETLPGLRLVLPQGELLEIYGRIDRLDAVQEGDNFWIRIIDYKSRPVNFKLVDFYWGLELQLLTYLEVVLTYGHLLLGGPCLPAAVLYFPVINPLIKLDEPPTTWEGKEEVVAELEEELIKKFKMKGLLVADLKALKLMDHHLPGPSPFLPVAFNKDGSFNSRSPVLSLEQFTLLRQYLRKLLGEIAQEILEGNIELSPYRKGSYIPCKYCPYQPVCGFDPLLPGNRYRFLPELKIPELWEAISYHLESDKALKR